MPLHWRCKGRSQCQFGASVISQGYVWIQVWSKSLCPHTLNVLGGLKSAQNVTSCMLRSRGVWGFWHKCKRDLRTPSWVQHLLGPESAQKVNSWLLGSRDIHRHPYCKGLRLKWKRDIGTPLVSSVSFGSQVSWLCQIMIGRVLRIS